MKSILVPFGLMALGFSVAGSAQSLEETYASLCSDQAAKGTETCNALRKAMLEKLSAESGATSAITVSSSSQPVTAVNSVAFAPLADTMAALAANQGPGDARWGMFSRLVGSQWASPDYGDKNDPKHPRVYRGFLSFSYLDDGQALEIQDGVELTKFAPARIITLRPTSQTGVYNGEIVLPKTASRWKTKFRTDPNGAIVSDWYKVIDAGHGLREMHARHGYRLMPDGTLAPIGAVGWEDDRPALTDPEDPKNVPYRLKPYDSAAIHHFIAEQIASYPDIIALEKQTEEMQAQLAQMQRERAARKASSGGLLGSLLGVAVGAIAGDAFGLNGMQTVGAMMKGAALIDPNAAPLGALGDTLLTQGSGAGGLSLDALGNVGSSLSGSASSGSYPTRPNALSGSSACSMMDESNYRSVALSDGLDVQLKTMCGQAFEYYTMYKRAIAQGYSEADANRTYDAHQQAALNAISFYNNNRAD